MKSLSASTPERHANFTKKTKNKNLHSVINTLQDHFHFITLSQEPAFFGGAAAFAFERRQHLLSESAVTFAVIIR